MATFNEYMTSICNNIRKINETTEPLNLEQLDTSVDDIAVKTEELAANLGVLDSAIVSLIENSTIERKMRVCPIKLIGEDTDLRVWYHTIDNETNSLVTIEHHQPSHSEGVISPVCGTMMIVKYGYANMLIPSISDDWLGEVVDEEKEYVHYSYAIFKIPSQPIDGCEILVRS